MKITEFLKEDNGTFSSMRLLSFLSVLCFIADWIIHIVRSIDFNPPLTILGFVLGVVGAKVAQKIVETKNSAENSVDINIGKQT